MTLTKNRLAKLAAAPLPAWKLRLYVADNTSKSVAAFRNLEHLCEEHLAGRYHIEVIDLLKNPQLAQGDQILAVPTVVRKLPAPIRKIIGTLADTERVLVGARPSSARGGSVCAAQDPIAMPAPTTRQQEKYILRLYVASSTPQSATAYRNLKNLCEKRLAGRYVLEVIDLVKNPELARADEILAVPTLVRKVPTPIRKFIGTLSDTARVLIDFDLRPNEAVACAAGKAKPHV